MKILKESVLMTLLLAYVPLLFADVSQINGGQLQQPSVNGYKHWHSGKSVTANYQMVPVSNYTQRGHVQSNPWKKKSFFYGATNNQRRPWGNVPSSRARSSMGMHYFDERFKQSSHQYDDAYTRQFSSQNFSNYPGMGGMNHRYGGYPYGVYPPNNYYRNNRGLFGFMNNFMPW